MLWSPGTSSFRPSQLMAYSEWAGAAAVGHIPSAAVSLDGNALSAAVGLVTDITDPAGTGGWTNLVNVTGGPLLVVPRYDNVNSRHLVEMWANTSGHSFRTQVLIDDTVVGDLYVVRGATNTGGDIRPLSIDFGTLIGYYPIYSRTSFVVRAARGSAVNSGEFIKIPIIDYLYGDRR